MPHCIDAEMSTEMSLGKVQMLLSQIKLKIHLIINILGHTLSSSTNRKQCVGAIFGEPKFTNLLYSAVELPCLRNFLSSIGMVRIYRSLTTCWYKLGHFLFSSVNRKQSAAANFCALKFTSHLYSPEESPCLCNFSSPSKSVPIYLAYKACILTLLAFKRRTLSKVQRKRNSFGPAYYNFYLSAGISMQNQR